jgi:hypothetical protein
MALTAEVGERLSSGLSETEADPSAWDDGLQECVADELAANMICVVRFADVCGNRSLPAAMPRSIGTTSGSRRCHND